MHTPTPSQNVYKNYIDNKIIQYSKNSRKEQNQTSEFQIMGGGGLTGQEPEDQSMLLELE